jgi:ubiquitin-protein ligase
MAHISRRLTNESRKWEDEEDIYNLISDSNETKVEVYISEIGYLTNLVFDFIICFEYPFKPPKINYKGISIKSVFKTNKLFRNDLKKIMNTDCLCCSSMTCSWGPTLNIINLVNEIKKFLNIKLLLVELFFARKVLKRLPNELSDYTMEFLM